MKREKKKIFEVATFLKYYNRYLRLAGVSELTGVNKRQLSHYIQGVKNPSEATVNRIESAIHLFADELKNIKLKKRKDMKIVNLTQHGASAEQIAAGVVDLREGSVLKEALTFNTLPSKAQVEERARLITGLALESEATHAMIGGAPFLMGILEKTLKEKGITPLYAFSERVSVETTNAEGEVIKTSVFKHKGFVEL